MYDWWWTTRNCSRLLSALLLIIIIPPFLYAHPSLPQEILWHTDPSLGNYRETI
jgi:hypothetical protein